MDYYTNKRELVFRSLKSLEEELKDKLNIVTSDEARSSLTKQAELKRAEFKSQLAQIDNKKKLASVSLSDKEFVIEEISTVKN